MAFLCLQCTGCSVQWLLLLQSTGSRAHGLLVVVACSLSCCGMQALEQGGLSSCGSQALECRLCSCGAWAQLPHGMRNLPRPGIEPLSPTLPGRFLTNGPLGKSQYLDFRSRWISVPKSPKMSRKHKHMLLKIQNTTRK